MKKTLTTIFTAVVSFTLIASVTEPVAFHTVANENVIVADSSSLGGVFGMAPTFGERIASFDVHMLLEGIFDNMPRVDEKNTSVISFNPQPIEIIPDTQWSPKNEIEIVEEESVSVVNTILSSSPVVVDAPAPVKETVATVNNTKQKSLSELIRNFTIQDATNELSSAETAHIEQTLAAMFQKFPAKFTNPLVNLTLKTSSEGPRGLAGSNTMILRVSDMKDSELVGVAIHELGHVVDLGHFTGSGRGNASGFMDGDTSIATDDVSSEFYAISWKNSNEKISTNNEGFVSGYASSDPFEDFAETFNYYTLHADEFKVLAKGNVQLAKKYEFMKNKVFDGKEFTHQTAKKVYSSYRPWDTTVLSYDWDWYKKQSF
ncbi:MAG: putative zinc-binding metallopeptidase [Candidatus Gracilibacteria bacterium]